MTYVSWKRPLALASALFVLGSFAYWMEYSRKPKKEEAEEASKKLFDLKDKPVAAIRLTDGARGFTFRCLDVEAKLCKPGDNSKWEMSEPSKIRADDSNVNSLLSSLANVTSGETIDLATETPEKRAALLKDYGLGTDPRQKGILRRAEITDSEGKLQIIYLGETHPIGDNIFGLKAKKEKADAQATAAENTVYLVPSYFKANFDHDLTYWRDKKLFNIAASDVQAFEMRGSKAELSGTRRDGQWVLKTFKGPASEFAGDIENVDSLLSAIGFLTARHIVSEDKNDTKAKTALRGARELVSFVLRTGTAASKASPSPTPSPAPAAALTESRLTIFEKRAAGGDAAKKSVPVLYATVSNLSQVFELEPNTKDRLDKGVKDLRLTKLITSMERFSTRRIEAKGGSLGANPLVVEQNDGVWKAMPEKSEVDLDKVNELLDKLSGNRIRDFLPGAPPAGEASGLQLSVSDEKASQTRSYLFWKNGDRLYARDLAAPKKETLLVDSAVRDSLPWDRSFFAKKATPPAPAPSAAAAPAGHTGHNH